MSSKQNEYLTGNYNLKNFSVVIRPIKVLKQASFQPESRTEPRGLKTLIEEIITHGLFYPILIDDDNNVIDGHRRLNALISLGETTVPVLIARKVKQAEAFASVNSSTRKMSGRESQWAFLHEPDSVPKYTRRNLEKIRNIIGKDLFKQVVEEKKVTLSNLNREINHAINTYFKGYKYYDLFIKLYAIPKPTDVLQMIRKDEDLSEIGKKKKLCTKLNIPLF